MQFMGIQLQFLFWNPMSNNFHTIGFLKQYRVYKYTQSVLKLKLSGKVEI